ncbi:S-adenosyl-L-methionine-dependent methyltransferase [Roridomyces roridus]|uniref:S-adenosyl-L-methionine-dependent methyltransferase n=1 Tax=Roridomyces roridus TaxID=1738132 RepID=A0AAD7B2J3_9AGAR|nr:S-adenosyl-L-methionine-dependent methyltransferase [Roridomyces roridus]
MTSQYTHGHHESVLRSHSWRTAENSCGYLLSSLKPDMHILDVGCGPGTITLDLARLVPDGHITGIEPSFKGVLQQAQADAVAQGVSNVTYSVADVLALDFPDASFDVVHAHQVLQHVPDPVQALREMVRVTKPGGFVAVRDADYKTMVWYPENAGMSQWLVSYDQLARSNGGEPNAGRHLLSWALQAGLKREQVTASASSWCFSTPEDVAWWSSTWADRVLSSNFAKTSVERGFLTQEDLDNIGQAWRDWGAQPDAWFAMIHGELKQEARVAALQAEVESLQKELGYTHPYDVFSTRFDASRENVDAEAINKKHIKLLHRYNEAKDATQILIGKLATLKETTIRQIHDDLDLHDSD